MTLFDTVLPYQTATWLSSRTEDSIPTNHRIAAPGDMAKERLVARKLGVNGWKRWQYFRQNFSRRWGDEGQCPVSPRSQDALLKALESLDFSPSAKPGLFLTDDGYFELAWRDTEGRSIQIEFGPNEFELFVEGTGVEETHPNSQMEQIIAKRFNSR
ncbi:MAG: hypothetical protein NTW21_09490 [Verrucomicrobia bacterium]|nr:hypothetical protein [Verrucomicrobiota bacterium]